MHCFQLLREVNNNIIRVKESSKGSVYNLGSIGRVGTNISKEQGGTK